MSFEAKVFNVLISSPDDTTKEREVIRRVLELWNAANSESKKIILFPVDWETSSYPQMGEHPQDILNEQICDKCDLLVGVFLSRIGTPTKEYLSGTVEEITRHVDAQKPAMVYFSSESANPEILDEEQNAQLKKFQDFCRKNGLYKKFKDIEDFGKQLAHQIQLIVNNNDYFKDDIKDMHNDKSSNNEEIVSIVQSSAGILTPHSATEALSLEAKILLKEASLDENGAIIDDMSHSSTRITTNKAVMIHNNDPRIIADWESALDELLSNNYVEQRSRGFYKLTKLGYQAAELIIFNIKKPTIKSFDVSIVPDNDIPDVAQYDCNDALVFSVVTDKMIMNKDGTPGIVTIEGISELGGNTEPYIKDDLILDCITSGGMSESTDNIFIGSVRINKKSTTPGHRKIIFIAKATSEAGFDIMESDSVEVYN